MITETITVVQFSPWIALIIIALLMGVCVGTVFWLCDWATRQDVSQRDEWD